jgi:hypothetical protein
VSRGFGVLVGFGGFWGFGVVGAGVENATPMAATPAREWTGLQQFPVATQTALHNILGKLRQQVGLEFDCDGVGCGVGTGASRGTI